MGLEHMIFFLLSGGVSS